MNLKLKNLAFDKSCNQEKMYKNKYLICSLMCKFFYWQLILSLSSSLSADGLRDCSLLPLEVILHTTSWVTRSKLSMLLTTSSQRLNDLTLQWDLLKLSPHHILARASRKWKLWKFYRKGGANFLLKLSFQSWFQVEATCWFHNVCQDIFLSCAGINPKTTGNQNCWTAVIITM